MVVFGDFNANSSNLYNNDITRDEGRKIEAVTLQNGLHQEEHEQPHALINSSLSNNLIFNSQTNLLIYSGVHPSLHSHCHHQIFAKFQLDIVFPLPYEREIWHYRKANIDLTLRAIHSFNWKKAFSNTHLDINIDIDFNQTIINILYNFIPHERLLFDYRDPL